VVADSSSQRNDFTSPKPSPQRGARWEQFLQSFRRPEDVATPNILLAMTGRAVVAVAILVAASGATYVGAAGSINPGSINQGAEVSGTGFRLDPPSVPPLELRIAVEMFELVNVERASRGLNPLTPHDQVGAAARAHAGDMAVVDRLQHIGSDGSDAGTRIAREGFNWGSWGENIGVAFTTAQPVFDAWMGSDGHRDQILGAFTFMGVGAEATGDGTPYWVLLFAT
jgi:uncharacterized protein YkwD